MKQKLNLPSINPSEITPPEIYARRREFMAYGATGLLASTGLIPNSAWADTPQKLSKKTNSQYSSMETLTTQQAITSYNNFYEFGTDKSDPAHNAKILKTNPWVVHIEGLVKKPKTFDIDQLLKLAPMEERIYRLRCVEGWSMVIPWVGYSLSNLIRASDVLGSAKYIEFISLADPAQMPYISSPVLKWPYTEGLRLDEAMHPLTLLTFGLYGEVLPKQNGAPVRITVPWKYGFKSAKSIVKIRFTEHQPTTSWNLAAPSEYGFYSNVNPQVNHPRWSQATERRITGTNSLISPKIKTLPFNGYEQLVGSMYAGMDLHKYY
jgi:sulfoxide reductase catalytic subunit YedY